MLFRLYIYLAPRRSCIVQLDNGSQQRGKHEFGKEASYRSYPGRWHWTGGHAGGYCVSQGRREEVSCDGQ
jgi:hypothetical protein